MFDKSMLHRPGLAIDPVNDNRHKLGNKPFARESVPYVIHLPEEGIGILTYTWVNRDSVAGALMAVFGPGIGPVPIQQRIPDRPVSPEMDFSNWQIADQPNAQQNKLSNEKFDGLSMQQDLKFGSAHVRWQHPQATMDFTFEAYHPPYAYGSHKDGCPAYTADNRIEQSGRVKGTLTLNDRVITFDTTGHRDHSWGTRDWTAFQHYKWFQGQAGDGVSVHFWQQHALGRTTLRGYVFKDKLMAEVTAVEVDWQGDENYRQQKYSAIVTDEAGRRTTVSVDVYAHYPLIPDAGIVLNESAGRAVIDGKPGLGWLEMAWPKDYLDHIIANSPY